MSVLPGPTGRIAPPARGGKVSLLRPTPIPFELRIADSGPPTAGVWAQVAYAQFTRFWVVGQLPWSGQSVVAWGVLFPGSASEEGGELVAGAGCCWHGDRWREQGVPAGAGGEHRGYRAQG